MTLTEFLLARIAEDEAEVADWRDDGPWGAHPDGGYWVDPHGHPIYAPRARILAECGSKRRIVAQYKFTAQPRGLLDRLTFPTAHAALGIALQDLALPYADHPDYNPDWRP